MSRKFNHAAYRRNVRKACAALGHRVPQGYSTAVATNGDFVVYTNGQSAIVGRLVSGAWEAFA